MKLLMMLLLSTSLWAGNQEDAKQKEIAKKLNLAHIHLYEKEHSQALVLLEEVLKLEPEHMEANLERIKCLKALNKAADFQKYVAMSKDAKAKRPTQLMYQAQLNLINRQFDTATKNLEEVIQLDKKRVAQAKASGKEAVEEALHAHILLGNIKKYKKDLKGATEYYLNALKIDEDHPETYFLLGEAYFKSSQGAKAANYWQKYVKMVLPRGKRYQYVKNQLQRIGGN